MTHVPYILKEEELEMLLRAVETKGEETTYEVMKHRSLAGMREKDDVDEILLDQSETILKRARTLQIDNENDEKLQTAMYKLSSMLRIMAHEIYREYLKKDKERDNERFLRLVK